MSSHVFLAESPEKSIFILLLWLLLLLACVRLRQWPHYILEGVINVLMSLTENTKWLWSLLLLLLLKKCMLHNILNECSLIGQFQMETECAVVKVTLGIASEKKWLLKQSWFQANITKHIG